MSKKLIVFLSAWSLFLLSTSKIMAAPVYTEVGTATNSTSPSVWESINFDITSLISGASNAVLSFDIRNDYPPFSPQSTTSKVSFGVENSNYFVHLDYVSGWATSHWRNVQLLVDGKLYVDQFGAYNNHLGDLDWGTAWEGLGSTGNIAGLSGESATTFTLSAATLSQVPVPAAVWLFGSGLMGLVGARRKSAKS